MNLYMLFKQKKYISIEESILNNITNIFSERKFSKLYNDKRYFYGIDDITYIDNDNDKQYLIQCIYNQINLLERRICYLYVDIICSLKLVVIHIKINKHDKCMVIKYEYT